MWNLSNSITFNRGKNFQIQELSYGIYTFQLQNLSSQTLRFGGELTSWIGRTFKKSDYGSTPNRRRGCCVSLPWPRRHRRRRATRSEVTTPGFWGGVRAVLDAGCLRAREEEDRQHGQSVTLRRHGDWTTPATVKDVCGGVDEAGGGVDAVSRDRATKEVEGEEKWIDGVQEWIGYDQDQR